jgi:hypothetical protein
MRYQFTFRPEGEPDNPRFGRLLSFSGAAMKNSTVLDKVISWQMEPLRDTETRVKFSCDAELDGLPAPGEAE